MDTRSITPFLLAAILSIAVIGCESSDEAGLSAPGTGSDKTEQTTETPAPVQDTQTPQKQETTSQKPAADKTQNQTTTEKPAEDSGTNSGSTAGSTPGSTSGSTAGTTPSTPAGTPTMGDAVAFGSLKWVYGGRPVANGAKQTSATIKGLSISGQKLAYSWGGTTLASWGLADNDAGAVACLFVQTTSGAWKGGKFDWISTSRRTRNLENVFGGYGGWSLADVPNPCAAAFVIVSSDGKKRTNVISCSWKR